jgi:DNA-binding PadR family transcriptional regulator
VSLDEALVSARDRVHDRLPSGAIEPVLDDLEAEQLIRRRYERETELDGSFHLDLVEITITEKGRRFHAEHPPSDSA